MPSAGITGEPPIISSQMSSFEKGSLIFSAPAAHENEIKTQGCALVAHGRRDGRQTLKLDK